MYLERQRCHVLIWIKGIRGGPIYMCRPTIYLLLDRELPHLASLWWTAPLQIFICTVFVEIPSTYCWDITFLRTGWMVRETENPKTSCLRAVAVTRWGIKMDSSMTCYVQMAICRCALSYRHRTCKSPTEEFRLRQLWQEAKYWHTINTLWRYAVRTCRGFCEGRSKLISAELYYVSKDKETVLSLHATLMEQPMSGPGPLQQWHSPWKSTEALDHVFSALLKSGYRADMNGNMWQLCQEASMKSCLQNSLPAADK